METALSRLMPFFERAMQAQQPLVLATVVGTAGSTYRKTGAQMLIGIDGEYVGLLSGGCLEGDLREHAQRVLASGDARIVEYDMRGPDDELWGLGAGCEGAMQILLQRLGPQEHWEPLRTLSSVTGEGRRTAAVWQISAAVQAAVDANTNREPVGSFWLAESEHAETAASNPARTPPPRVQRLIDQWRAQADHQPLRHTDSDGGLLLLPYSPAPSLLLLGAGPDARPVAELARFLGWTVTVYDHRASLLEPRRFAAGTRLLCGPAAELGTQLQPATFTAIVIMSHHLNSDRNYLQALATLPVPYLGLLGPAPRREKLLSELPADAAAALRGKLHAPVGFDFGGRGPEDLALGIVAHIQCHVHGRPLHRVPASPDRASTAMTAKS